MVCVCIDLKSNMDRFIAKCDKKVSKTLYLFKIQYG